MLTLDLAVLERERSLRIDATIPTGHGVWKETDFFRPLDALEARMQATVALSGEYVVRGVLTGVAQQDCRRCLRDVATPVGIDVVFSFVPGDLPDGDDPDTRTVAPGATELDLSGPIREELILSIAPYAVCAPDCKGLCPQCGVDRNVETCQCVVEERDPRWDALRALRTD